MLILAKLCLLGSLGYLLAVRLRTLLTYFQQEEYDGARFFGAWTDVRLFDVRATVATIAVAVLFALGGSEVLLTLFLAGLLVVLARREGAHRYKKALVMTERTLRMYRLTLAALWLLALPVLMHALWAVMVLQVAPAILVGVNRLLQPFRLPHVGM